VLSGHFFTNSYCARGQRLCARRTGASRRVLLIISGWFLLSSFIHSTDFF
jgi:hypothetical protein